MQHPLALACPLESLLEQSQMHSHLQNCLEEGKMWMFPFRRSRQVAVIKVKSTECIVAVGCQNTSNKLDRVLNVQGVAPYGLCSGAKVSTGY